MTSADSSPWRGFALILASGIAASVQVGKLPPMLPELRNDFALGLIAAGLLASSFAVAGTLSGLLAGWLGGRFGRARMLAAGLLLQTLGSLLGAAAQNTPWLVTTRLMEGLGFILIVVSGPSLITAIIPAEKRNLALGLWSLYMPVGVSLGIASAALIGGDSVANTGHGGWRLAWLLLALPMLPLALALLHQRAGTAGAGAPLLSFAVLKRPGPWALAFGFGFYSAQWFAIVTWLPSFLREAGSGDTLAAFATALAALANIVGILIASVAMHRGWPRWLLIGGGGLGIGICGVIAFAPDQHPLLPVLMGLAGSAIGGLTPAAVLASAPHHAKSPAQTGMVNGLIVQVLNLGIFTGPPAFAGLVALLEGWQGGRWLFAGFGLICLGLGLLVRGIEAANAEP